MWHQHDVCLVLNDITAFTLQVVSKKSIFYLVPIYVFLQLQITVKQQNSPSSLLWTRTVVRSKMKDFFHVLNLYFFFFDDSVINDILGRYEDDPQIQSTIFQTISILAEFGKWLYFIYSTCIAFGFSIF